MSRAVIGPMGVRSYQDLSCWQLADAARRGILEVTTRPPFNGHRWLSTQLQRSTTSACANMAEGFARYAPKDFARFLTISKASLTETLEHVTTARQLGLLDGEDAQAIESN